MKWQLAVAVLIPAVSLAGLAASPGSAATRPVTQTLVFDALVRGSFVDAPPAGPSSGDTELSTARLRDASGRFVGTARVMCVFTKQIPGDVLERCSGSANTRDGTATLTGVGHLYSMNPPWQVTGRSGAYRGLHGTQTFSTDIPLDPNVPLAAGRAFSISVIKLTSTRRLHAGVVPRPEANAPYFHQTCRHGVSLRGSHGGQAARIPILELRPIPSHQIAPTASRPVLRPARPPPATPHATPTTQEARAAAGNPPRLDEPAHRPPNSALHRNQQIKAALADDAPAFVRTVYQQSKAYNNLVFRSAVFGVQACTFG